MFRHILLPLDGSALAEASLHTGLALARGLGGRLRVLTVTTPLLAYADVNGLLLLSDEDYRRQMDERSERIFDVARRAAQAAAVAIDTVQREGEQPWRVIVEHAVEAGCDVIVMASHGRGGLQKLLLGSQTQKVLAHTALPVLITR